MVSKNLFFAVVIIALFCLTVPESRSQVFSAGTNEISASNTDRVESQPSLGIEFSKSAKLKIFVRKTEYRANEIIFLDIGMLAKNPQPVYLPTDLNVEFRIKDGSGKEQIVRGFYTIHYIGPSFVLSKDALIYRTYRLVVGCKDSDNSDSEQYRDGADDPQFLFENNLFQTIPEGCIDVAKPQRIQLSVDLANREVVLPQKSWTAAKTAVGTVRSEAISIDIVP